MLYSQDIVVAKCLGHSRSDGLLEAINLCEEAINFCHLVPFSMDGLNVNWKTFNKLKTHCKNENNNQLFNIGSFCLYQLLYSLPSLLF